MNPQEDVAPAARTTAVLVAAGSSSRMALPGGESKVFAELGDRCVLEHACAAFDAAAAVRAIVLVVAGAERERVAALVAGSSAFRLVCAIVAGGAERSDSVRAGVEAAPAETELVAIHDAARPFVSTELIGRAIDVAARLGAALVATPATDTVKLSTDGRHAERTLDRATLWSAQTPQVFHRERFVKLCERARAEGYSPTDDSALWERYVGPVPLVPGDASNYKLTTRKDLELARLLLREGGA